MRLKFGYAITCHKAQGSEWNNVFVKCLTHQSQLTAAYFRWFYTAMTRTVKNLYLLDPPNLKLGGGIKNVGNIGINPGLLNDAPTGATTLNSDVSLAPNNFFDIPETASFLRSLLLGVQQLVSMQAIEVVDIIHNQYQEAYFFKRGGETARVNIGYNSKGKIVALDSPQLTELGSFVVSLLAPLKLNPNVSISENFSFESVSFSKDFLAEFHRRIVDASLQREIQISNVTEAQWSLRYTFTRQNEVAVYDVWFNGKSQFTRCAPVLPSCTKGALVRDVNVLLTEDLAL
jgi:hypothetical protein